MLAAMITVILPSCAAPETRAVKPAPSRPGWAGVLPADTTGLKVIVDTEEMLIPDPKARTLNRLYILRVYVRRYAREHKRLPDRLADFLPPGNARPAALDRDAWGNMIRYHRSISGFELRAAGPDGRFGTTDDFVATEDSLTPELEPAPGPLDVPASASKSLSTDGTRSPAQNLSSDWSLL